MALFERAKTTDMSVISLERKLDNENYKNKTKKIPYTNAKILQIYDYDIIDHFEVIIDPILTNFEEDRATNPFPV